MRKNLGVLAGSLLALAMSAVGAHAGPITTIPLDLNDFFFFAGDPVTIAADGSSATIGESEFASPIILEHNPAFDPPLISAVANSRLIFDFAFTEAQGNDDEFLASVLDDFGFPLGPAFEFFSNETSAGSISFDLSPQAGIDLGIQFALFSFDDFTDPDQLLSTVTISDLRIEIEAPMDAPAPAALAFFAIGLPALVLMRRRRRRPPR